METKIKQYYNKWKSTNEDEDKKAFMTALYSEMRTFSYAFLSQQAFKGITDHMQIDDIIQDAYMAMIEDLTGISKSIENNQIKIYIAEMLKIKYFEYRKNNR
ncbi:MAG: hypothetical protein J5525_13145 [Lachnospiraceae bacterium]|nr:hypothetical protein [Lachnospiraceae bacterium]